jgi:hypothetical protein
MRTDKYYLKGFGKVPVLDPNEEALLNMQIEEPQQQTNNTYLYLVIGALALYLLTSSK